MRLPPGPPPALSGPPASSRLLLKLPLSRGPGSSPGPPLSVLPAQSFPEARLLGCHHLSMALPTPPARGRPRLVSRCPVPALDTLITLEGESPLPGFLWPQRPCAKELPLRFCASQRSQASLDASTRTEVPERPLTPRPGALGKPLRLVHAHPTTEPPPPPCSSGGLL